MSHQKRHRSALGSKRVVGTDADGRDVWEVAVSAGYRSDGRQRRVTRRVHGTERDADMAISRLAGELGASRAMGDGDMTLDAYYWVHFSPARHASTTRANSLTYDSHYRAHISEELGGTNLAGIDGVRIQRWVNRLPPQSAPNYVRTLRAILSQAELDGLIDRSPMEGRTFRMPHGRRTAPLPVWGAREVSDALSREDFADSNLYALWLVMVGAGLSRSEALALDWEGVSWESALGMDGMEHWTARVTVSGAVTSMDGLKGPKNDRRYRTVPLPPVFADRLRLVMGTGPICQSRRHVSGGWVLSGHRITPDRVPEAWRRLFEPGAALDGLPFVHLNRMRATYATLAQASGIDSTLINAMQGRSKNSQVLYSNYLNPQQDAFSEAQEAVARRLSRVVSGS